MQKGTWIICIDPYGKCETPAGARYCPDMCFMWVIVNGDLVCNDCYEMMQDHQEESKYI